MSSSETDHESVADSRTITPTSPGETGDSSFDGESDSETEMALILASLGEIPKPAHSSQGTAAACTSQRISTDETTEPSSQDTTLQELQEQEKEAQTKDAPGQKRLSKRKMPTKRGVSMSEKFFAKIGWTRSFIFGPADPVHNPHMVWCRMCKKNFSIRSKGPIEILRHHRTEKHLRRDQLWRTEHLKSVDLISGKVQHRVGGRNGDVLTKIELAKELPKFIYVDLVDVGERFPIYDDFVQGRTTALVTPESRAKMQLSIVGDFLQTQGDLSVLRSFWARISSYTDYQASLCDFDWTEEHITVSLFLWTNYEYSVQF